MKRIIFIIVTMCLLAACGTKEQKNTHSSSLDELQEAALAQPRFKMIPTTNFHILLKLDSRTGKVWMTQYQLSGTPGMEVLIPGSYILEEEKSWNGRFELYPTQNMFNFLLVDTHIGKVYQVQWSTEENNRITIELGSGQD